MKITLDTWIVSDTHFAHDNIVRYCNRPENHNDVMVQNWNSVVGDEDDVLHLGDLIFNKMRGTSYARALRGRKYLLRGNHDHGSTIWYNDLGFVVVPRRLFFNWGGRQVLFTHEPEDEIGGWAINIHGHIHNNGYEVSTDRTKDYRNVSIEVMDYTPVRLRGILEDGKYQPIRAAGHNDWTKR